MDPTSFVICLTTDSITDAILEAQERVWYAAPNITEARAHALAEAAKRGVRVQVVLDVREENYRNGYGDVRALRILEEAGVEVHDDPYNMVSFLIADDRGVNKAVPENQPA